jgi:recombinational DNA repair protein RecT
MAMNTAIKRLVKRLPKSVELTQAYANDETVKYLKNPNEIDGTYNILDEPPAPENVKEGSYSPEYYQEKVKMYYLRLEEIDGKNWGKSQQDEVNKKYLGTDDINRCYVIDDLRSLSNKLQQEITKLDEQEIVQ